MKPSVSVSLGGRASGLPAKMCRIYCVLCNCQSATSVSNMFSSKSFIVSAPTFGSLIHFGVMFVYGVRSESTFILALHGFPVDRLLERLFFLV